MKKTLEDIGAELTFSNPYTPAQNGIAERTNRTLVELARTLLIQSKLPQFLWTEAIGFSRHILNCVTIHKEENKSAYELACNKKPYLSKLHPFGTECFFFDQSRTRRKFSAKGLPGKIVGFCEEGMGYRVWNAANKTVFRTKDVRVPRSSVLARLSQEPTEETPQEQLEEIEDQNTEEAPETDNSEPEKETEIPERKDSEEETCTRTREKRKIKRPKRYEVNHTEIPYHDEIEPVCPSDIEASPNRIHWERAMKEELRSMAEHDVWYLTDLPVGFKPIGCRWVFKMKKDEHGNINKFKARLVVKGYSQKAGIDYTQLFSPVARFETIRTILSIAASESLILYQFDIKTAFLYAKLEEEIYMKQPEYFDDGTSRVCRLNKALYGLKQAPRCFHQKMTKTLLNQGLIQSNADPCVFYRNEHPRCIMCIYVDDAIIAGESKETIMELLEHIKKEYEITFNPLSYFLGIHIDVRQNGDIHIHQQKYIHEALRRFNLQNCKPSITPSDKSIYELPTEPIIDCDYRELIGTLMYLTICTRPDIAFSIGYLSRFLDSPTEPMWQAALKILRYLKNTDQIGILYKRTSSVPLQVFSDSDFASDPKTRKSTTGSLIKRQEGPIIWQSNKQSTVALSSTEAEFISASETIRSVIWVQQLLAEVGYDEKPTLFIDNLAALNIIKNPTSHRRTKHIDVKYFFIRNHVEKGRVSVEYVPTEDQEADILTKPLSKTIFIKLRSKCGITVSS